MINTKTRTFIPKLTMVAFLFAMVLLLMPMNTFAAKKPGQVKNIEEVKATDHSITFKFKKVKGAKSYQIQVYEATKSSKVTSTTTEYGNKRYKYNYTWKIGKKVIKKAETRKNTYTIKGLSQAQNYAVKIRACNGKSYGKWKTQYLNTTYEGVQYPGESTATGENLKRQYEEWKKPSIDSAKKRIFSCFNPASQIKCIENVCKNIDNPGQYSMDEVYKTYKKGTGTDLEIYHVCMDLCKDAGVKCALKKRLSLTGSAHYILVIYYDDGSGKGRSLEVTPRHKLTSSWNEQYQDEWE